MKKDETKPGKETEDEKEARIERGNIRLLRDILALKEREEE